MSPALSAAVKQTRSVSPSYRAMGAGTQTDRQGKAEDQTLAARTGCSRSSRLASSSSLIPPCEGHSAWKIPRTGGKPPSANAAGSSAPRTSPTTVTSHRRTSTCRLHSDHSGDGTAIQNAASMSLRLNPHEKCKTPSVITLAVAMLQTAPQVLALADATSSLSTNSPCLWSQEGMRDDGAPNTCGIAYSLVNCWWGSASYLACRGWLGTVLAPRAALESLERIRRVIARTW